VVIADKAQRVTIPAGDSGRATFALRLDDDAPPSSVSGNTFTDQMVVFSAHHPGHLLGYWRLGEAASPFADTSGLAPARDGVADGLVPHLTTDIVGALPPDDDDGAVLFAGAGGAAAEGINVNDPGGKFNFGPAKPDISLVCFVRSDADAGTFPGSIVGDVNFEVIFPFTLYGWRLRIAYPARTPVWERADRSVTSGGSGLTATVTGGALAAGAWAFLVGTYSAATGHQLYVNGSLAGTDATTFNTVSPVNGTVRFGGGLPAGLDEVSLWDVALTATEVSELYAAAQV
jgi:hypothetical protein